MPETTEQKRASPDHPRCIICGFFQPELELIASRTPTYGECRRREPTFFERGHNHAGYWPRVYASDWCGEHTGLQQRIELVSDAGESFPYLDELMNSRRENEHA